MEEQDKKDSKIPRIFDNACSTRSASELVCILRRIYCTFSNHRLGGLHGQKKCLLAVCVLPG